MDSPETPQSRLERADELFSEVGSLRHETETLIENANLLSKRADQFEEMARRLQSLAIDDRKVLNDKLDDLLQRYASIIIQYQSNPVQRREIERITLAVEEGRASHTDIAALEEKLLQFQTPISEATSQKRLLSCQGQEIERILQSIKDGKESIEEIEVLAEVLAKYQEEVSEVNPERLYYIYVSGFPTWTSEDFLRKLLRRFGALTCIIPGSDVRGRGAGFGFVGFHYADNAMNAAKFLSREKFIGKKVKARLLRKPQPKNGDAQRPTKQHVDQSRKRTRVNSELDDSSMITDSNIDMKRVCLREAGPTRSEDYSPDEMLNSNQENTSQAFSSQTKLIDQVTEDGNHAAGFGAAFIPLEEDAVGNNSICGIGTKEQPCVDDATPEIPGLNLMFDIETTYNPNVRSSASYQPESNTNKTHESMIFEASIIKKETGFATEHNLFQSSSNEDPIKPHSDVKSLPVEDLTNHQLHLLSLMLKLSQSSAVEAREALEQQRNYYQKTSQEAQAEAAEEICQENNLAALVSFERIPVHDVKETFGQYGEITSLKMHRLKRKSQLGPGRLFLVTYANSASCEAAAQSIRSTGHAKHYFVWRPKI